MEQSYKEKYEQAIERLKQWDREHHCAGYVLSDRDKFIFPELAESEDERIRKALIRFHKSTIDIDGIKGADIILWLEKQKGNIGGISPKWSVEDEENFCSVYLDVKSARQNTVNSLSGELKEQEQKRMDEVISWLRSLKGRVFPKQEWSEDDEQHIDSLLKRLDALCRNKFERTRFAISEDRDWLKSLKGRLKPQNRWKPSDEQIAQLQIVIDTYGNEDICDPILTELLFQLKKLRGKV